MRQALKLAEVAGDSGEIPVGALLVQDGNVIGAGGNARGARTSPLEHAEILALRRAARRKGDWRFPGATMYVTLEPCSMCSGALLQARVSRLVFGAYNRETGCGLSLVNLADVPGARSQVTVVGGVLESECLKKLNSFFSLRRGGRAWLNALDSKSSRG
jgi:tRNA(adenine34) deaminase